MGCSLTDGFIQQMLASVSHDLVGHAVSCGSLSVSHTGKERSGDFGRFLCAKITIAT